MHVVSVAGVARMKYELVALCKSLISALFRRRPGESYGRYGQKSRFKKFPKKLVIL
jgi:hypothetical protein